MARVGFEGLDGVAGVNDRHDLLIHFDLLLRVLPFVAVLVIRVVVFVLVLPVGVLVVGVLIVLLVGILLVLLVVTVLVAITAVGGTVAGRSVGEGGVGTNVRQAEPAVGDEGLEAVVRP